MGSRSADREFLTQLPADLTGCTVQIRCTDTWPTTSFVDETIVEVLERRGAAHLTFSDVSPHLADLAAVSADCREVTRRVSTLPAG
jgi:IS1 family transposase